MNHLGPEECPMCWRFDCRCWETNSINRPGAMTESEAIRQAYFEGYTEAACGHGINTELMMKAWNESDSRHAIAAGTRSDETPTAAQSEGCQSGGEAASPNPSSSEQDALREALIKCRYFFQNATAQNTRAILAEIDRALTASPKGQDHE